ncbi:uncharacterized protein LOC143604829 [Bidens hawaiensis]|uniref:uncharacterized protein LOC143604829 n=1 Tax=Bidens hawaiensis TaxID=980011 RepID=UPI0040491C0E
MEPSNITMFNNLDVTNNNCVLKVRILRLWRLKDNNKPGEDWSIEMILKDETDVESKKGKTNNGVTSYSLCCSNGDVQLLNMKPSPMSYLNLFLGHDSTNMYFLQNIRRYNSMFSFTSLGGKIDNSINRGSAPYTFRLGGESYHSLESLLPMPERKPWFSQLYINDTENEYQTDETYFGTETDSNSELLEKKYIHYLKDVLDSHNLLVKSYQIAMDCFQQNPYLDLKLRIIGTREGDARTYNLPTTSDVAALIVGNIGDAFDKRDIIVTTQSGSLTRISELHPSYVPLQYPIFFQYGDDGYSIDILHRDLRDDDDVEDVLKKPTVGSSRFTGWMECNQIYDLARTLTYVEFPTKFFWKQDERVWELLKRGFSIGRIHHVPPAFNEAYYLRIRLNKVRGPKCFEDIRTVDGEVCATYRDACFKRGLLDDDNGYIEAIEEASHTASGYYLRSLFATMLITYSLSRPDDVWEKTWKYLIGEEQCNVYNEIMEAVDENNGGVFFVYGYGGTGKTFLWKTLSASIISKAKIILNVASSGIASLLLEGGTKSTSYMNHMLIIQAAVVTTGGRDDWNKLLRPLFDLLHKGANYVVDKLGYKRTPQVDTLPLALGGHFKDTFGDQYKLFLLIDPKVDKPVAFVDAYVCQ